MKDYGELSTRITELIADEFRHLSPDEMIAALDRARAYLVGSHAEVLRTRAAEEQRNLALLAALPNLGPKQ